MLKSWWGKLSTQGVNPEVDDPYTKSRITITNQIALLFILAALIRLSINLVQGHYDIAFLTTVFIALLSLTVVINRYLRFLAARIYLCFLFIASPYLVILFIHALDLGTYIGFYFIQINSLIVFLLTFDRLYDRRSLYNGIFIIIIINIILHDLFYDVILKGTHDIIAALYRDNYLYIKLPQLTVSLILIVGLRLWKQNFHKYSLALENLNREVVEKNCEIEAQNEELKSQADQLASQNDLLVQAAEEIQSVNSNLEYMVEQRTNQIREQNRKLIDFAYFNSHKVRGPLARILGLIHLLKIGDQNQQALLHELLHKSATELDYMIKEINLILDNADDDELHLNK